MVQNTVITLQGSEANDASLKTFSSSVPWFGLGANLLVYLNGQLTTEYSVVDENTIEFPSSVNNSDQIMLVITSVQADSITNNFTVDRIAKKVEGKVQSSVEKEIYEESLDTNFIVHTDEIWSQTIDTDPVVAVSQSVAQQYVRLDLTQDVTVNDEKGWYASSNGSLTGRLRDWIPPKFGQSYHIRLYDANNNEIVSSDDINWHYDYQAGYLTIENDHSYPLPFSISGYRYVGTYGSGFDGISHWLAPVERIEHLPQVGNKRGDARLVFEDNSIWKWNNVSQEWKKITSSVIKDSVPAFEDLDDLAPKIGEIRYVTERNTFYVWNGTIWDPVVYEHDHDDRYYTQGQIATILDSYAPNEHLHDSVYYRQHEIINMVRWRPSVEYKADLPAHTSSRDGDIIYVRSENTIYHWDANYVPLGRWVPLVYGNLSWKPPVQTKTSLPLSENTAGDVRLVLDEGTAYWWDGVIWIELTQRDHDHDDRYYTKDQIHQIVRWKEPVSSISDLPSSLNEEGDVRLVLENKTAYYWNGLQWKVFVGSSSWRDPVDLLSQLPLIGNDDKDIRIVRETMLVYMWDASSQVWEVIANPAHDHDERYYTRDQLNTGQLDNRYYTETEINAMFNKDTGHDHDGVDSKRIDYNNLLNIPTFYWKSPVANYSSLPVTVDNRSGDARIVLNENAIYVWTGSSWRLINSGQFASLDHDHDDRYYTESEVDTIISDLQSWVNALLAQKADLDHHHDERYYTKQEVDQEFEERFDVNAGHNHDGINSRRISYYSLTDVPPLNAHDHDDLYYRKEELYTPGDSQVHWDNVVAKPDLANGHWRSPVQTYDDLPMIGNLLYDIRMVIDTGNIYEWDGTQWVYVGHWVNPYVQYWHEPVDEYDNLPMVNNANGDVRLVMEENILYRWDSSVNRWVVLSSNNTSVQIYLNGLQLTTPNEWIRIKEKGVELLVDIEGGDRVTMLITGDYHIRKDFIAYNGQTTFEVLTGFHRQDFIIDQNSWTITLSSNYIMGGKNLLVWLNGLIQRVDEDYREVTPTSFTFNQMLLPQDHVIAIIMDQASGEGEYVIEEYQARSGQSLFNLENNYIPGSGQLLVYLNGDLLKPGTDYLEKTNSTIELVPITATAEDWLTFIILGRGITGGCCNAKDIVLGTPSDGSWRDGLLYFFDEMKVNDSIDEINEVLKDIAPEPPKTFIDKSFIRDGLNLYSGYVSDDNLNYEIGPGQYHDYLTEDDVFKLFTPDDSFSDADKGILNLYINDILVDSFRLGAAFVETNDTSAQTAMSYGQVSQGARENEGVIGTSGALRNSTNGFISIMDVRKHNNFRLWQKGKARININQGSLRRGYNEIYIEHVDSTFSRRMKTLKLFLDISKSRPTIHDQMILENVDTVSNKWVSGVRYFSIGDTFRTIFTIVGAYNNTYKRVPVEIDMPGLQPHEIEWNDSGITNISNPPRLGDLIEFNDLIELNEYNEHDVDAVMTIKTYDPFGPGEEDSTKRVSRLVNTYSNGSTNLIEYFRDEIFRLPEDNYNSIPVNRTNVWDSSQPLTNGQALLFDNELRYPNIDFTSSYRPAQSVNYSSFTGPQNFYRAFYKQTAKNGGRIQIDGITRFDLENNLILIDIKLPTQTGWLSLNKPYDVTEFNGIDGDGCFLKMVDGDFEYSSGTLSTANSGYMIIMRITLPDISAPNISYVEVKW